MPVASTFPTGLRDYQITGALDIVQRRRVILADQPGLGKTAQALLALEVDGLFARPSTILIASTMLACQLTWAPELKRRLVGLHYVLADLTDSGGKKSLPSLADRDSQLASKMFDAQDRNLPLVVLVNFESLRWKMGERPLLPTMFHLDFDAVVLDEAHLVIPTDQDKDTRLTQFWYGLERLPVNEGAIQLAMTGTPDRGKLHNRYGYHKWFWPARHKNFLAWAQFFFDVQWVERGWNPKTKRPNKVPEYGGLIKPVEWAGIDRATLIRRTKGEVLTELPPKQYADDGAILLPLTPTQRKAYDDFEADLEDTEQQLRENDELGAAQAVALQFYLRGRQMADATWDFAIDPDGVPRHAVPKRLGREGSSKLAWLFEWLEARGYTVENWDPQLGKVVIASFFVEVLKLIRDELAAEGIESAILSGETPQPEKVAIEEAFQRGGLRIVLLSSTIGSSITLDAADDLILFDLVPDPDALEQVEDRVHRASSMHQVTIWRLVALGTVDVAILELADQRFDITRATLDGVRGVDFARRLVARARKKAA